VVADGRLWAARGLLKPGWWLVAVGLLVAAALGVAGGGASFGAVGSGRVVTEVNLSKGDRYDTIARVGGRLILSGSTVSRSDSTVCNSAVVNPATLVLSQARSGNCDDPALAGERVLPIITGEPNVPWIGGGVGTDTVRISHITSAAPGYRVGPVVMSVPQISDEHAGWTYGDGYRWLYDGTTRQGSELLRISLTTGSVLQRLAMPDVPRPILAADDDGLWMAPAVNSGGHTVYHVELGASAATPVFSLPGLQYAAWVVAAGHDVWLNVGSGSKTETLWRLVGASATRTLHVTQRTSSLDNEVETQGGGTTMVGNANDGLWTAVPATSGTEQRIVRITPSTGALTNIALVTPGYANPSMVLYGTWEAVTFDGSMYLLDPPNGSTGFSALYRITPPS
jgi:hypothetical protein